MNGGSPGGGSPRRVTRRAAMAGTLAGLFAAACTQSASRARRVEGGFVDDGMPRGHALRDGTLGGGSAATERRCRVLVVGGGIAGLSAAWRLRRSGVSDVTLLELGSEVGGTSRGAEMTSNMGGALRCPFGAHYLPQPRASQRAVAAFLADAGIAKGVDASGRLRVEDRLFVRDPAERIAGLGHFEEGLWLTAGANPGDQQELADFEGHVEELIRLDEAGARYFDLPVARSSAAMHALDSVSARDWMTSRGYESERLRWYLEYATRDDLGAALGDTSAWALLHYFAARADIETKESAAYLTWPDGNAQLVRELRRLGVDETRTGEVVVHVDAEASPATATSVNGATGAVTRWTADAIVLATPQFITRRLLRTDPAAKDRAAMRYSPWVVANLHLDRMPESRGFPHAWDSVLHGSESLGYVDACHQLDRADAPDTVWTWYLPIIDSDERAARTELLARPWEAWRDAILDDLRIAHPDIDEVVSRIDVWRWGHAMIKPTPGTMWGGGRERAAKPIGGVHFAHSDLSGVALFEEANWQGTRAAEEILKGFGMMNGSLL